VSSGSIQERRRSRQVMSTSPRSAKARRVIPQGGIPAAPEASPRPIAHTASGPRPRCPRTHERPEPAFRSRPGAPLPLCCGGRGGSPRRRPRCSTPRHSRQPRRCRCARVAKLLGLGYGDVYAFAPFRVPLWGSTLPLGLSGLAARPQRQRAAGRPTSARYV